MKPTRSHAPALVGAIEVTRVVRDVIELHEDRNGRSFGAHVDEFLTMSVEQGHEVQEMKLVFDRDTWERARAYYGGTLVARND